jgi:hypothetical protein
MSPSYSKNVTLPLTVRNTGFLLDRLGEDCAPLQFLRELTQNAIEAIQRTPERTGEIIWDVDWTSYELGDHPAYKLSITDTGDGMTGGEMVRYINQLSSSMTEQSLGGNYGVGAKVAAATRNHAGLIYLSWKDSQGSVIHLWRDAESGQYGLRQFNRPDGTFGHFTEVEESIKPELIKEHGTKIVLLGNDGSLDTMTPPEGSPAPSRWVAKYLNSRYFRIPEGITIRSREGWEHPRSDGDRNLLRSITGQAEYLGKHSQAHGTAQLEGATAHWWVLKDEQALSQNSGLLESSGHIAALYKDELYEMTTSRAGRARLQMFGILLGPNRVVIYVEPTAETGKRISPNTARTHLLINNDSLPWADWAVEFKEKIPDAIKELMEEVAAGSSASDHTKTIRERLKQLMDLYRVSRYRLAPSGDVLVDPRQSRGGTPNRTETTTHPGSGSRGGKGGTAGGVYSVFQKRDGMPGEAFRPDPFPEVQWVSVEERTREPGDIEDRAARYLMDQNVLFINADFRVFNDMILRWAKEFAGQAGVKDIIQEAVRGWFEQALTETVIGVQALKDSKEWSIEQIQTALSEEALTACVMARYHVHNSVKRELGSKLGKLATA